MTERNAQSDANEPPEDVASLYSWANLHGGKYRDFSASRAQTREKARQRVEQAIEEERQRARPDTEAHMAASRQEESEGPAPDNTASHVTEQNAADRPSQQTQGQWPAPRLDRLPLPSSRPLPGAAPAAPMREEIHPAARVARPGGREEARPAWLSPERGEPSGATVPSPPAEDSLQGTRDRLAARWFALQGVFEGSEPPAQVAPASPSARAPVLAIFSLAGGVGKTSIAATLGRALSGRGERVLLVDAAAFGLLPFFFGARDQRPGFLRTFSPPPASGNAPIQMITLDPNAIGAETASQEPLTAEISLHAHGAGRVIVDLPTASGSIARRIMRLSPQILVPLVPDMASVVSVTSIDAFFQHSSGAPVTASLPNYIFNQFDPSLPLHLDVREILREQLGDRLLPLVLRHSPAVSEALAEGMTVMDYAPNSSVVDDYSNLAAWVKSLSAPATASFRGVRWSER